MAWKFFNRSKEAEKNQNNAPSSTSYTVAQPNSTPPVIKNDSGKILRSPVPNRHGRALRTPSIRKLGEVSEHFKSIQPEEFKEASGHIHRLAPNLDLLSPKDVLTAWVKARRQAGKLMNEMMKEALVKVVKNKGLSKEADFMASKDISAIASKEDRAEAMKLLSTDPALVPRYSQYEQARNLRDALIIYMNEGLEHFNDSERKAHLIKHQTWLIPHPLSKFQFQSDYNVAILKVAREDVVKMQNEIINRHGKAPGQLVVTNPQDRVFYNGVLFEIKVWTTDKTIVDPQALKTNPNLQINAVIGTMHTKNNAIDFEAHGDIAKKLLSIGKGGNAKIGGFKKRGNLHLIFVSSEEIDKSKKRDNNERV